MFLPVVPHHFLSKFQKDLGIHNGAFLLAHDVVKHRDAYCTLSNKWTYAHTILDNSVIELGTAVDFEMVRDAAAISKYPSD